MCDVTMHLIMMTVDQRIEQCKTLQLIYPEAYIALFPYCSTLDTFVDNPIMPWTV